MKQVLISEWKKIPHDARLRHLVLGKLKRNIDSPLKALSEFCYCVSVLAGQRFRAVMRSGKFSGWLGYSGANLEMPVRCAMGIYVTANNTMSVNFLRICLLAEALGIASGCYVIYEDFVAHDPMFLLQGIKKAFHRLDEGEINAIKPLALVLGAKRIVIGAWNECLLEYVNYVKTSVPFGEKIAPSLPGGYEHFSPIQCVKSMRKMIEDSGLDRYSVCLEYISDSELDPRDGDPDNIGNTEHVISSPGAATVRKPADGKHHRQFVPGIVVW